MGLLPMRARSHSSQREVDRIQDTVHHGGSDRKAKRKTLLYTSNGGDARSNVYMEYFSIAWNPVSVV